MKPLLVTVVALAVLAAGCAADSDPEPNARATTTGAPSATATATAAPRAGAGQLVYLVPTALPNGMKVRSTAMRAAFREPATWAVTLGVPDGDVVRRVITAGVNAAAKDREVGEEEARTNESVRVGRIDARMSDNGVMGVSVDWFDNGRAVRVIGAREERDEVIDVARRLRLGPADKVTATTLDGTPAGFEVVDDGGSDGFDRRSYDITIAGTPPASLTITVAVVPREIPSVALTLGRDITYRGLRGIRAAASGFTHSVRGQSFENNTLTWRERDDVIVTLQGIASHADLIAIAEGLEERTEAQWRAELKVEERR